MKKWYSKLFPFIIVQIILKIGYTVFCDERVATQGIFFLFDNFFLEGPYEILKSATF